MLPTIVLMLVLRLHCLVLDLIDLVLLVFQANLRTSLWLLTVEKLETTDQVASAFFELFWLLYGGPACDVYAHQLAVCVKQAEVEKRHWAVLCVLAPKLHADQSAHEVSLFVVHNIHQSQGLILFLSLSCSRPRSGLIAFILILWLKVTRLRCQFFNLDGSVLSPKLIEPLTIKNRFALDVRILNKLRNFFRPAEDLSNMGWVLQLPHDDPQLAYFWGIYLAEIVSHPDQIVPLKHLIELVVLRRHDPRVINPIRSDKQAINKGLAIRYPQSA